MVTVLAHIAEGDDLRGSAPMVASWGSIGPPAPLPALEKTPLVAVQFFAQQLGDPLGRCSSPTGLEA